MFARADAAAAFDFDAVAADVEHDADDLGRCAVVLVACQEAGARLDEVGVGRDCALAGFLDLGDGQGVGLEDDLDFGAVLVADADDGGDVGGHVIPAAAADPAEIGDDVELLDGIGAAVFLGLQDL